MKTALITGANGQDGVLLGHHLLSLGYRVIGLVRGLDRAVTEGVVRKLVPDKESWRELLAEIAPDEIYHLGGDSFAGNPQFGISHMLESNVMLTAYLLESAAKEVPESKVFLAGSAAVFGDPSECPQTETTPQLPVSLYGAGKAMLHHMASLSRKAGQFVAVGMLFNHESPLRPVHFVTRKITLAAARIAAGLQDELLLGNLEVVRDWGHAEDYVRAMHLIIQADKPDDWIVASGEGHTVRDFCQVAFSAVGLDYLDHVRMASEYWRPAESVPLVGDPSRIMNELGWRRTKDFITLVNEMVDHDVEELAKRRG